MTTTTTVDAETTIRALEGTFARHLEARDVPAIMESFYADDCQFHMPNAPPAVGKQEVAGRFQALIGNGLTSLALETLDVGGSGDTLWNRGRYNLALETPEGPVHDTGTYVTIFERRGQAFRCVVDIFNSDLPS